MATALADQGVQRFQGKRYLSDKKAIVLPFLKATFPFFKTQ